MRRYHKTSGFSLTEMLIATGIMAIGLVMVATVFPVGVKLTSLATERSIGAVAADEAFAKVRLYGFRDVHYWPAAQQITPADPNLTYYSCSNYLYTNLYAFGPNGTFDNGGDDIAVDLTWQEFRYPSVSTNPIVPMLPQQQQPYHWSALCRRISDSDVQVTVFVSRKTSIGVFYSQDAGRNLLSNSAWPAPIAVNVRYVYDMTTEQAKRESKRRLEIVDGPATLTANVSRYLFRDGYTIVDDYSGTRYKILEVEDLDRDKLPETLVLTEDWKWQGYESDPTTPPSLPEIGRVWVVPPAIGSDRYPCVGVYQKILPLN